MASRPLLVELVGPPGAGKSTVMAALRDADALVAEPPVLSRSRHAPRLAAELAVLGATIRRRGLTDQDWPRQLLIMGATLQALPHALASRPPRSVIVFDQGPIFTLTRPQYRDARLADWARARSERYHDLLDVVVWLDAPDAVLIERIQTRDKPHRLRGRGDAAAIAWLAEDRAILGGVIERLEGPSGGPVVMRFDTSEIPAADVAARTLAAARAR